MKVLERSEKKDTKRFLSLSFVYLQHVFFPPSTVSLRYQDNTSILQDNLHYITCK